MPRLSSDLSSISSISNDHSKLEIGYEERYKGSKER